MACCFAGPKPVVSFFRFFPVFFGFVCRNWSPGFIGHSTFTLSPVHAAVLETAKGPVVRVYEFDRIKNTTWQVDIMLDGIVTILLTLGWGLIV